MLEAVQRLWAMRDRFSQPLHTLWIVSGEADFSLLVSALGAIRALPDGYWQRLNPIIVGDNDNAAVIAIALRQRQYGGLNVPVTRSLDEALELARRTG